MLFPNYLRCDRSENSPRRSQVFRPHRPLIKAKLRSITPTVFSLLEEDQEKGNSSYEAVDEINLMEDQVETRDIPETPSITDSSKVLNPDRNLLYYCSDSKWHRSEDIAVREDENGIRSHFCPLTKYRTEARDDESMTTTDIIKKGCDLRSEEITCLEAEKPSSSESAEDSESSNEEAWKHDGSQGKELTSDTASLEFLLQNKFDSSLQSEKTLDSWFEGSSDEGECDIHLNVGLLQEAYANLQESDIEEFKEATVNVIHDIEKIKLSTEDEQVIETHKDAQKDDKYHSNTNEEKHAKYAEEKSIMGDSFDNSSENIKQESILGYKPADENNLQQSHATKSEINNFSDLLEDRKQTDDVLESIVEHAIFNATIHLQDANKDQTLRNKPTDLSKVKPIAENGNSVEDSSFSNIKTKVISNPDSLIEKGITSGETHPKRPEEHAPRSNRFTPVETAEQDNLTKDSALKKTDAFPNEEKKDNLVMEPIDTYSQNSKKKEETQPDLATALRFMTEVYPCKDDDEFYSDTLNISDISSEKATKESSHKVTIYRNYQEIKDKQSPVKPSDETSPCKSSAFEPVLTENERAVKRPRSKFSKFLQSFKRRLERKNKD